MRNVYLVFFVLALSSIESAAQVASSCIPTPQLIKAYKGDVVDMALERIYNLKSPDQYLVEIPQSYQDTIMGAIAAVYHLNTTFEADSIFLNYCIHRYRKFNTPLSFVMDPGVSWINNWRNLNIHTGDIPLDHFLSIHGISLESYDYTPGHSNQDVAYLSSDHVINWKAFGDSLMTFNGCWGYGKMYQIGFGDIIQFDKDSVQHLEFGAGRGDCPSGCTEYKIWLYAINDSCLVTLNSIKSNIRMNYYPNCDLRALAISPENLKTPDLLITPNPVQNRIYIRNAGGTTMRYMIYDLTGRMMLAGLYQSSGIDISLLPANLYLIRLKNEDDQKSSMLKFSKQ